VHSQQLMSPSPSLTSFHTSSHNYLILQIPTKPPTHPATEARKLPRKQAPASGHLFRQMSTHAHESQAGKPHTRFLAYDNAISGELVPCPVNFVKRCSSTCAIAPHAPHSKPRIVKPACGKGHTCSGTVAATVFTAVTAKRLFAFPK
jgi:hypothetical protein